MSPPGGPKGRFGLRVNKSCVVRGASVCRPSKNHGTQKFERPRMTFKFCILTFLASALCPAGSARASADFAPQHSIPILANGAGGVIVLAWQNGVFGKGQIRRYYECSNGVYEESSCSARTSAFIADDAKVAAFNRALKARLIVELDGVARASATKNGVPGTQFRALVGLGAGTAAGATRRFIILTSSRSKNGLRMRSVGNRDRSRPRRRRRSQRSLVKSTKLIFAPLARLTLE